jgi:hypothetical protein
MKMTRENNNRKTYKRKTNKNYKTNKACFKV